MTLILILVVAIAVISLAERSVEHLLLAIAGLCFSAAAFLFIVDDVGRAILLSSVLAAAVLGASIVKYNHSGLKLIVTDLPLAFAGTVPFFVVQYPLAVTAVVTGSVVLVGAVVATLIWVQGTPISLGWQTIIFGVALIGLIAAYRASGGAAFLQRSVAQRRCFLSTFIASCSTRIPGASSAA